MTSGRPGVTMRQRVISTDMGAMTNRLYTRGHVLMPWKLVDIPGYGSVQKIPLRINGIQITESEGHPWKSRHRVKDAKSLQDIGGNFFTQKKYVEGDFPTYNVDVSYRYPSLSYDNYRNVASFKASGLPYSLFPGTTIGPDRFPPSYQLSDKEMDTLGATAVSRCSPTNTAADAATALGELRNDGLPSLPGLILRKGISPKAFAEEFLNYQFGVSPTVSDARKLTAAIKKSNDLIVQFEKDAGKLVRRKYRFPQTTKEEEVVVSESDFSWSFHEPYSPGGRLTPPPYGRAVRRRWIRQRVWFSGAFTYHLPLGMDSRKQIGEMALRADRLGAIPTPETLWNLAPWSWAVDWFTNVGDVVANYSDVGKYGLVMPYGYLMVHTIVKDTYTLENYRLSNGTLKLPSTTLVTETKQRRRATPFGFGVSFDGLSAVQLAILAALGITRSGR